MKATIRFTFFILVVIPPFLSACLPTSTPVPTRIIIPTTTSTGTPTPLPAKTPVPLTTTAPAPEKALEYLNDVEVAFMDTFDKHPSPYNWDFDRDVRIADGVLELPGKSQWTSLQANRQFSEGQGASLDFLYAKGSVFEVYVVHGHPSESFHKTFGVFFEKNLGRTNIWAAKNSLGGETIPGDLILQPDTNYSLMMAVIPDGEFLMVIWESSDPSKTNYYHEKIGKNWSDLKWRFGISVESGIVLVDNYQEIKFDSIK